MFFFPKLFFHCFFFPFKFQSLLFKIYSFFFIYKTFDFSFTCHILVISYFLVMKECALDCWVVGFFFFFFFLLLLLSFPLLGFLANLI